MYMIVKYLVVEVDEESCRLHELFESWDDFCVLPVQEFLLVPLSSNLSGKFPCLQLSERDEKLSLEMLDPLF